MGSLISCVSLDLWGRGRRRRKSRKEWRIIQGGLRVGWHLSLLAPSLPPLLVPHLGNFIALCKMKLCHQELSVWEGAGPSIRHALLSAVVLAPTCLPAPVPQPWPGLAPALRNSAGGRAGATEPFFWKVGSFSLASLSPMHGNARASCPVCRLPPHSHPRSPGRPSAIPSVCNC